MYFTGYHGTTTERGKEILDNKCFKVSESNKEWLGTGIYFYNEYRDAYDWSSNIVNNEDEITVLHILLDIDEDYVLELDSEKGMIFSRRVVNALENKYYHLAKKTAQENQCTVSNFIWGKWPETQMLIASFASEKTPFKMLRDVREKRREFCLRNNNHIESVQEIERGD